MTDQQKPGERDSATPGSWGGVAAKTQSIAEPVLSGDYGATSLPEAPEVPSMPSKLPWFAALVGAFVLLAGGGFFALTAFGASGGAETPEEAVDALIEAANGEDFITMAELLEPAERRTLAEPMITEVMPELVRLGVLDDRADAGNVDGFDWEFTDVTYRVETVPLNADMVRVYFTGGLAAAEFNAAEFPFGDEFRERFGSEIEDEPRTSEVIEDTGNPMVLVERDGRWYVSALFTIAENARIEAGEALPDAAAAPPALGSSSPEAAVEAMFAEMVELDMAGFIGRMDPEELAVLYRYSPIFLDDAQAGLDSVGEFFDENDVQWNLSDFDFDVETDGDDASVVVRGFRLDVSAQDVDVSFTYGRDQITGQVDAGDYGRGSLEATPSRWVIEGVVDGERMYIEVDIDKDTKSVSASGDVAGTTFSGSVAFDENGQCSRYELTTSDGMEEIGCLEDDLENRAGPLSQQYVGFFEQFEDEFGGFTVAARRTDGEWYVSPVTTTLDYYLESLRNLDEGQFEQMLDGMAAASVYGFGVAGSVDSGVPFGTTNDPYGDLVFDAEMSDQEMFEDEYFEDEFFDEPMFEDESFGSVDAVLDSSALVFVDRGSFHSINGTLESGTFDNAVVELAAGDLLTVTAQTTEGSGLDTTLEVFGPDGSIAYNDDADVSAGLGVFDSKLEVLIPSDGDYTIEIRSFGDFGEGAYTLTIERSGG